MKELQQNPIAVPVLHWWTGTVEETRKAVALGATSLYIQPSLDTRNFAQQFRWNGCLSKATTDTLIHPPLSHVGSSG
jgi:hypothetical protein